MFKDLIDRINSTIGFLFIMLFIDALLAYGLLICASDLLADVSKEVKKIIRGGRMRIYSIKDGSSQQIINLVKTDLMREEILKYIPLHSRMLEAERIMIMSGFDSSGFNWNWNSGDPPSDLQNGRSILSQNQY